MLSGDDLKFAIEDARLRHEAVLKLIFFTDTQATSLLGLYISLGVACATAVATHLAVPNSVEQ
jgi:hypothetical protein